MLFLQCVHDGLAEGSAHGEHSGTQNGGAATTQIVLEGLAWTIKCFI